MKLKLALTLFVCAIVTVTTGCAGLMGAKAGGDIEGSGEILTGIPLAPDFRIADIPVPAGFEFDRPNSFVFQNSAMDVGSIKYAGKEDISAVAQFYLDEMERYKWTLLSVTEQDTIVMIFDKPEKACQVLLTRKTFGTLIQVSFYPKAAQM
jgi:hypothetical protein